MTTARASRLAWRPGRPSRGKSPAISADATRHGRRPRPRAAGVSSCDLRTLLCFPLPGGSPGSLTPRGSMMDYPSSPGKPPAPLWKGPPDARIGERPSAKDTPSWSLPGESGNTGGDTPAMPVGKRDTSPCQVETGKRSGGPPAHSRDSGGGARQQCRRPLRGVVARRPRGGRAQGGAPRRRR